MAFIERFVRSDAAGGGDGSVGTPWTLTESFAQAVAADRVNVQSDAGYSVGPVTLTNAGNVADYIAYRGYDTTIGDLESPSRADGVGPLDTTGFPVITCTGTIIPQPRVTFQNLRFTGSLAAPLLGDQVVDAWSVIECDFVNNGSNSSARCVQMDNDGIIVNSDFECTAATHGAVVDVDASCLILSCRMQTTQATKEGLTINSGCVAFCTFFGSAGSGMRWLAAGTNQFLINNTFQGLGTAMEWNVAPDATRQYFTGYNHVTDCANFLVANSEQAMIEYRNRTRDNTTPRTNIGDGILTGEITTDTGGAETDYVNVAGDDYRLILTAPGRQLSLPPFRSLGANEPKEPATVLVNSGALVR